MTEVVDVLVVTAPGCHFCEDAIGVLGELAKVTPLSVRTVHLASEEGRRLVVRHRVPFPPIVLVDGEYFGYGRISRRKLEAHLGRVSNSGLEV